MTNISSTKQGGYFDIEPKYVSQFRIYPIDPSSPADVAAHDRMVALVERMLDLHKRKAGAAEGAGGDAGRALTEAQAAQVERDIAATDAEIDALVYALYGLSEEEIAIVEGRN